MSQRIRWGLAPPGPTNRVKRVCDGVVVVHGLAFGAQLVQTRFADGVPESGCCLTAQLGHQRRAACGSGGGLDGIGTRQFGAARCTDRGRDEAAGCALQYRGRLGVAGCKSSGDHIENPR